MTLEELQEVYENAAEAIGAEFRSDYSGRGMYGATCFAISGEVDGISIGIAFAQAAYDSAEFAEDPDDFFKAALQYAPTQTDSMGMGMIAYCRSASAKQFEPS